VASFKVTSIAERNTIDAAGNVVKVVAMTLKTTLGATGGLEIPSDQYEALTDSDEGLKAIQAMLASKADKLDAAFSM
jgi:hypothetical protein